MTHSAILKELKAKKYAPVYFLQSDESYFIDEVVSYIEEKVLDEGEKSFNQVVLYGKETNFKQIMDQARQFPMMASHRVVIVKEAQEMSSFEQLTSYIDQPSEQTILVLAYKHKSLDKRKKKIWSALKKNAIILETKKIYDNQIPAHIVDIAKSKKLVISPKVAQVMAENLGASLSKINNEINKLSLNLEPGTEVTLEHVENYVGISKDYNIFEFQKALGQREKTKAYKISEYFARNSKSHPIQMHVGSLYNYFCKLLIAKKYERADNRTFAAKVKINPFFAGEYKNAAKNYTLLQIRNGLEQVHVMDKKSKGLSGRNNENLGIYQEFLFRLFN